MNRTQNKNLLQLLIHFIAWLLLFGLPFLVFTKTTDPDLGQKLLHHGIILLSLLMVFYLNFFVLIERFLFTKKLWKFLLYNLALILVVAFASHLWKEYLPDFQIKQKIPPLESVPPVLLFIFRDVFPLLLTVGLSVAVKATGKWYELETQHHEEEKKRTEAELQNLRQQLNPHFLFNTLNNIYALIAVSPEKAQEAMLELSKLLRYVLYDNNENFVPLDRELNSIRNYIELMRIRLHPDVDVKVDIDLTGEGKMVPPLLFMSLIENAFKHGTSPDKPSFVHIAIENLNNRDLRCLITNSYFPKGESDESGSGIGLENLKRRLEILYPHTHILRAEKENDIFVAELIVPFNPD